MDMEAKRPLDSLLHQFPNKKFIVSNVDMTFVESLIINGTSTIYNNGFIYCDKFQEIMKNIIDNSIENNCKKNDPQFLCIQSTTGPQKFTKSINSFITHHKNQHKNYSIAIISYIYVEPCYNNDYICHMFKNKNESVAKHHHEQSWINKKLKILSHMWYILKYTIFIIFLLIITHYTYKQKIAPTCIFIMASFIFFIVY
jgi:hypothetical protein